MSGSIYRIVIGTAGHIDHGKSTLVRALTGIDPDRLPEEKERGLTIDLGFAPWKLADGTRVGFVDVPGHERFVKNMVAGATGIDFVILVIAADDGIMPQTREHLEIMRLLGVERGVVAITKIDLAEPGSTDLLDEEIAELVRGSFLESAPRFRISASSGEGMETFRAALEVHVRETKPRSTQGVFRMPIQRVFSSPGHGTVVTGIPISGAAKVGDRVEILPLGKTAKIRGIHAYKEKSEAAQAGHSSALNLADLGVESLHRGMVAATPGYFRASPIVEISLQTLARERRPLADLTPVRLHAGTVEALGTLVLLDRKTLAPGETAYAQIRLETPIVVAPGDRFVLRLETPPITVGGGTIVGESGRRLRRFRDEVIEDLDRKRESLADRRAALAYALERRGCEPSRLSELLGETKIPREELLEELKALHILGEAKTLQENELFLHAVGAEQARTRMNAALAEYFRTNPTRLAVEILALREATKLDARVLDFLLLEQERKGILVREKSQIRFAGKKAALSPEETKIREAILRSSQSPPFSPPQAEELAAKLARPLPQVQNLLRLLVDEGALVRAGSFHFSFTAIEKAREAIVENIREHGELDIPSLRDRLETSRKYLIPLLEHFDGEGLTLRQGGRRILKNRPGQ